MTNLDLLLWEEHWLVHTINLGIDTQADVVVIDAIEAVGRITHHLVSIGIPILRNLTGVPALSVVD